MNPAFQEGRRTATNTTASLANNGHPSPSSRRAGAGTMRTASVGTTGRPGPTPMSARQIERVNAANSRMKRTVNQVIQLTEDEINRSNAAMVRKMEQMRYSTYDAKNVYKKDKTPISDSKYEAPTMDRYLVGRIWVYSSVLKDSYGGMRYWVYNSHTNALLSFEPERGIAEEKRTYMPEGQIFGNYTAGTGAFGEYWQGVLVGVAGGMGGVALGAAAASSAAGIVVRAFIVNHAKKAIIRASVDATGQLAVGMATSKGSFQERLKSSAGDINWLSTAAAGLTDTGGLNKYAKFMAAFGTSAATNAYTLKYDDFKKYKTFGHLVDLDDEKEKQAFMLNVIWGTVFDQAKEYGGPLLEKAGRNTPSAMGMVTAAKYNRLVVRPPSQVVSTIKVEVLKFEIGWGLESTKKFLELYNEETPKSPPVKGRASGK